jgi:prephenate dehydrogenase
METRERMEVLVIGAGAMGGWFARLFKSWGWKVWVTDIDCRKSATLAKELDVEVGDEILPQADLVLVAVPISSTPTVVREVGGRMKKGALLMEVSSVKEQVISVMKELKSCQIELVALHPLFGPGATGVKGERFAFIPVKTGKLFKEVRRKLEKEGATLIKVDAEKHDLIMARVQALTHLLLLLYLQTCEKGEFQTHLSASLLELAKAMLAGNPSIYYEIQNLNRFAPRIRREFLQTWQQLEAIIEAGEKEEFEKMFKKLKKRFEEGEIEQAYKRLYAS